MFPIITQSGMYKWCYRASFHYFYRLHLFNVCMVNWEPNQFYDSFWRYTTRCPNKGKTHKPVRWSVLFLFLFPVCYHVLFSCIAEADANQNQGPTIKLQQNNGPVPDCDPLKEWGLRFLGVWNSQQQWKFLSVWLSLSFSLSCN